MADEEIDLEELNDIYLKMSKEGKDQYSKGKISLKKSKIVPPEVPWP